MLRALHSVSQPQAGEDFGSEEGQRSVMARRSELDGEAVGGSGRVDRDSLTLLG